MKDYPTLQEVLAFHGVLLKRYGGVEGVRDLGAIEAALFRPQSGYYSTIAEEAAALMESLLINHPFVDGNKRVAFAACDVFLRINGWRMQADPDWLFQRMMAWIDCREDRFERIIQDLQTCVSEQDSEA